MTVSCSGGAVACVDHTGIDIIARNPHTQEVLGISVKSRCRTEGREEEYVRILEDDFKKAEEACKAFECVPYFAIVVDAGNTIQGFILAMNHLRQMFPPGKTGSWWRMTKEDLSRYAQDPNIKTFRFQVENIQWW